MTQELPLWLCGIEPNCISFLQSFLRTFKLSVIFRRFHMDVETVCQFLYALPSVRLSACTNRVRTGWISIKFYVGACRNNSRENPNLFTLGHKYWTLCMKTWTILLLQEISIIHKGAVTQHSVILYFWQWNIAEQYTGYIVVFPL